MSCSPLGRGSPCQIGVIVSPVICNKLSLGLGFLQHLSFWQGHSGLLKIPGPREDFLDKLQRLVLGEDAVKLPELCMGTVHSAPRRRLRVAPTVSTWCLFLHLHQSTRPSLHMPIPTLPFLPQQILPLPSPTPAVLPGEPRTCSRRVLCQDRQSFSDSSEV